MSLTDTSHGKLRIFLASSTVFFLVLILWELHRFHDELTRLTKAAEKIQDENLAAGDRLEEALKGIAREIRDKQIQTVQVVGEGGRVPTAPVTGNGAGGTGEPVAERIVDPEQPNEDGSYPDVERPVGGMFVRYQAEPSTFNRYVSNEGSITQILNLAHDAMMSIEPNTLDVVPGLATSWEVSADKLRYTYHLREGVQFSDRTPFTADDVAFTFGVIMDENVKADAFRVEFENVERCEVLDPHTVVFHCKAPYWKTLYALGLMRVISKRWTQHEMERLAAADRASFPAGGYGLEPGTKGFGELYNTIREPSVGTGPYMYDPDRSLVTGLHVTLFRNPRSWIHKAHPGRHNYGAIRFLFLIDELVRLNELRKQNLDIMVVKSDHWFDSLSKEKAITDNYDYHEYSFFGNGTNLVYWNCRHAPFDDARVRKALAHCIDRETFGREVLKGVFGAYATNYFFPNHPGWSKDLEPRLLDLEKARRLLAEAGWRDTNDDGILDKDGKDFAFTFSYPSGNLFFERIVLLFQRDLAKVGIRIEPQSNEWKTFITNFYKRDFEAACLYNSHSDPFPDPYEMFHSSQVGEDAGNHSGIQDAELDRLLEASRVEFDRQKRVELFHRINHRVADLAPVAWLYFGKVSVLLHKRMHNARVTGAGLTLWNQFIPEELRWYDDRGQRLERPDGWPEDGWVQWDRQGWIEAHK
ncbi:MAG: ABC transporter substrate-binding protein [Planctomycetota bacterium]